MLRQIILLCVVETVEPGALFEGLFCDSFGGICGNAYRQEAHQLIRFGNIQNFLHPVTDPVGTGGPAFVPAAGITQIVDG